MALRDMTSAACSLASPVDNLSRLGRELLCDQTAHMKDVVDGVYRITNDLDDMVMSSRCVRNLEFLCWLDDTQAC
jgi:hypothetical protein